MIARAIFAIAAVVAVPLVAAAGPKQEAKLHVAKATKAHGEGKFDVALDELLVAYNIDPQPELLFAIAQVYVKLDRCGEAVPYYEKFAATNKDAQAATIVTQAIDACKAKIAASQPAEQKHDEEPAPITDKPAEPAPAPAPTKPDEPPAPAPAAPQPATADAPPPPSERPAGAQPWYRDTIGDTLVAGGAIALVASLVVYESAQGDLDDAVASTTLAAYNQHVDDAHSARTYSLVLFAGGAALAAGGVWHYMHRTHGNTTVGMAPASGGGLVFVTGVLMRWPLLVVALAGCLRDTQFHCDNDASCGPGGRCETDVGGLCSNADGSCTSGRRFGDSAGDLANTCVGAVGPGTDAGTDGPPGPGQCPSDYASMPGGNPGHVYKAEGSGNWQGANGQCMVETLGRGYLAIPDDGDELGAIANLADDTPYWVGISDQQQQGTFTNTKNQPQTFLAVGARPAQRQRQPPLHRRRRRVAHLAGALLHAAPRGVRVRELGQRSAVCAVGQ